MTITDLTGVGRNAAVIHTARDLVLLVARVGLGVMMVAHAKLEYDFGGSLPGSGGCSRRPVSRCPRSPGRPTCSSSSSGASR
jgi:hypothetical protein